MRVPNQKGYTMTEVLVVIVIIGVVIGIGTMSLFPMLQRQRVRAAASTARNVIRLAQTNAMKERRIWTVAFRNSSTGLEYRIYRDDRDQTTTTALPPWQSLLEDENDQVIMVTWGTDFHSGLRNDSNEVLPCYKLYEIDPDSQEDCRISFNYQGKVITPTTPRRISFSIYGYEKEYLHCVRLATLVGGVRVENGFDKCGKYGD